MKRRSSKYSEILVLMLALLLTTACDNGENREKRTNGQLPLPYKAPNKFENTLERDAVRASNQVLMTGCYNAFQTTSSLIEVSYNMSESYWGESEYRRVKYRIKKNFDGENIELNIKVALRVSPISSPTTARQQEMIEGVKSCVPKIQNVFMRYGIGFSMQADIVANEQTNSHDHQVNLVDGVGHSNTTNWFYNGHGMIFIEDELCLTMLHELGHYLSLDDEYFDKEVPNRTFISKETNPVSIMKSTYDGFEFVDFHPRHIQAILAPACPDFAREQGWKFPAEMRFQEVCEGSCV